MPDCTTSSFWESSDATVGSIAEDGGWNVGCFVGSAIVARAKRDDGETNGGCFEY